MTKSTLLTISLGLTLLAVLGGSVPLSVTALKPALIKVYKSNGWTATGDYVFKHFSERVDFNTASERCMNLGGRLATEVLRHQDAVNHIINENYVSCHLDGTAPWVGFTDKNREGSWVWLDGGSMDPETTAWNPTEPNNNKGNEDCAQIRSNRGTKILLNDVPCNCKLHYICEIKFI